MDKTSIKLGRIFEISKAVQLVGNYDSLPPKDAYWLGRLGDFCEAPMRGFEKERTKLARKLNTAQKPLLEKYNKLEKKDTQEAKDILEEINKMNEEFNDKIEALLEAEEPISIPKFKYESFVAVEDGVRNDTDKDGKVTEVKYKKGQALVPVQFFKLMGEYITEE